MARTWRGRRLAAAALVAVASGCVPAGPPAVDGPEAAAGALRPVPPGHEPDLRDHGAAGSLRRALGESLAWLESVPAGTTFRFGPREVGRDAQLAALRDLERALADDPPPDELARRVRARFEVLESAGGPDGRVLVTGYYEPLVEASCEPRPGYPAPIYGPPGDRVQASLREFSERLPGERLVGRIEGGRLVPYWDRQAIRAGALAGRGLEIAWARDPIAAFFAEVQGSATLVLPDGSEQRIGYAGTNGRPYRSIGKLLIDEGHVPRERMSMQAIRAWLERHPEELDRVLAYNPSVVFFRLLDEPALGSLGRPVTAGRSIASDPRLFPRGALAFLDVRWPETGPSGAVREGARLARFVLNQDQGGAIRGADRADLFLGRGARAGAVAGVMKSRGRLYFLAPRPAPAPAAGRD